MLLRLREAVGLRFLAFDGVYQKLVVGGAVGCLLVKECVETVDFGLGHHHFVVEEGA